LPVIYGILQYSGVLHGNGGFRITGSFDNPAGFAASLCAGLPAVFYRVLKNRACQNWFTAIVDSHWRIGLLFGLRK
jgi:hypothetical protein